MYNRYAYYAESINNNANTKVLAKNQDAARQEAAQKLNTSIDDIAMRCLGFARVGKMGLIEVL